MKKTLALILALLLIFALATPMATAFADSAMPTASESVIQTFREQAAKIALELIEAAIIALFGYLGVQAKKLYEKYVSSEIKQKVFQDTVRYVEQVYKSIHGRAKLRTAMERATSILSDYGIYVSEEELETGLEAAVNEFNGNFTKTADHKKTADELNSKLL